MLVYIDDIMLAGDNTQGIADVKKVLAKQFVIKVLVHCLTFWELRLLAAKGELFSHRGNMS